MVHLACVNTPSCPSVEPLIVLVLEPFHPFRTRSLSPPLLVLVSVGRPLNVRTLECMFCACVKTHK